MPSKNWHAPSQSEQDLVIETLKEFQDMQTWRNTTAGQWEEIAELILPTFANTFFYGNYNYPGLKKTQRQIDASGAMALHRFAAICDSLLTPRNMYWHSLSSEFDYLLKQRDVRLWYEQATKVLFRERYKATANFSSQNYSIFQSLGAFGTGGMFIDPLMDPLTNQRGLRYRAIPLGELFIRENHQGIVDGFIRWFRLTARQAKQKWGELPPSLEAAAEQNSSVPFNFIHRVCPRTDDYDPKRIDHKGMPWASYYISIEGKALLEEGGYHTFPLACSRYEQAPGETYGRSPAMMVLPALKTLNAQKTTFLKQGHRASDPVLLLNDDGLLDTFNARPGAMNKGGVNADGRPMVQVLPTGNIQINKEMMDEERGIINDAFLVTLFQILEETPQMTATEVIERVNEKGILLAPTVGRQQSEYLGNMIPREIDILAQLRMLPPMPPALIEARGHYDIVYTSPLSRAMRAQEVAGFMRTVESVKELVNITGDPSLLDPFEFDVAIPAIAETQAVPASWMATQSKMNQKRQLRARAQQQDAATKALPNEAAMIKARAVAAKAQSDIQGQQGTAPAPMGAAAPTGPAGPGEAPPGAMGPGGPM